MKNSSFIALLIAVCSSTLITAQPPPAPPPAITASTPISTAAGAISQFNYGPDGRATGFVIAPNTLVPLLPDWAIQIEMSAKIGGQARASGPVTASPSGMQLMRAQTLTVAGRTLTMTAPSRPAPYAGSGVIRALNYGPGGEINGFVLQNGMIAMTPPMGSSAVTVVKPGASIALSGFARSTPNGKTIVQVQSITANGQSIAMNMAPMGGPPAPQPDRPRADRRPAAPAPAAAPPPPGR